MDTAANIFVIDQDPDLLEEYACDFRDKFEDIETIIFSLEQNSNNSNLWHQSAIMTNALKTNACSLEIAPLIEPLSIIEDIFTQIYNGKLSADKKFCQVALSILETLSTMASEAGENGGISFDTFSLTQEIIKPIALSNEKNFSDKIIETQQIINKHSESQSNSIINYYNQDLKNNDDIELFSQVLQKTDDKNEIIKNIQKQHLRMLKELARLTDNRNQFWKGRTEFIKAIATKMNSTQGQPIDDNQLKAAIYIHDIGMVNIPDKMLHKNQKYTDEEKELLYKHPSAAKGILSSISGWGDAEEIAVQHHERPDGSGYPQNVKEPQICEGALIVSICDAFFSLLNGRADRKNKRTVLRALSEINNHSGKMFSEFWTRVLYQVLKEHHKHILKI
ncbi:MAG: HD domain-containing protein [Gammaproteobacteria bacterium]|nr:MAG: HD domain-containing protein [Gammaproteobacteria bacterium]